MCHCGHGKQAHVGRGERCLVPECTCKAYVCVHCGEPTIHGLQADGSWDVCISVPQLHLT